MKIIKCCYTCQYHSKGWGFKICNDCLSNRNLDEGESGRYPNHILRLSILDVNKEGVFNGYITT